MLKAKLLAGGGEEPLWVDSVFSAYTYTGNGSTQTITNGIDLAGKGGMVWLKNRSNAQNHALYDTARGATKSLYSDLTDAQGTLSGVSAFNGDGFALGNAFNNSAHTFASWTFRKAPKFFDVVTWTGNGANRTIAHSLGQEVGLILVKRTDATADWQVYHRSLANTEYMVLNSTAAKATGATRWNSTTPTTSVFSVGTDATVNASGGTYVAYLFAHDTGTDGLIQCGSGTGVSTVNLGWEPQYVLIKRSDAVSDWVVSDIMRGYGNGDWNILYANTSGAEVNAGVNAIVTSTGFKLTGLGSGAYIYLAIRRPNKPPTVGTQVFAIDTRGSTGDTKTPGFRSPFAADMTITNDRDSTNNDFKRTACRLTGANELIPSATNAEYGGTNFKWDYPNGMYSNATTDATQIAWMFKRAVGVFDVCCYTGTGSATTVSHGLGAVPELMIVKQRNAAQTWPVYHAANGNTKMMPLQAVDTPYTNANYWNSTSPTESVFTVGTNTAMNGAADTYVTYLFATKAGISKVGSYTGNGTTNAIDCGFTTGARFVMIKRTDSTGDWYVWDTVRGIVSGNDPYLLLNSTAAEVTSTDYIDPSTAGFELSSTAPAAINASGGSFIFLAFA